jgi:hypothetical protein
MGERIYDRVLSCGCCISTDKGGGLIPCCYPGYGATEEDMKKCKKAWAKWRKTEDYKKHLKEIKEKNR